uniref:Uncharacterized protein n=1 Tax=Oryza meridionalis TaxID=40149 RepID=A0A0E0E9W4_9ORYZ
MASYALDLRRGLAVFAGTGRPEEAVLRKNVAWADARRMEAVEIASAARRVLEKELRCMAARDHPVIPELAALITAMRESTKSLVLQDSSGGDAAGLLDSAIKFEDAVVEKMTALKEKLTRGVAAFTVAGEEELVQALQKHAATAEAEIAEAQAFSATLSAASLVVVQKRPAPETEEEPPRQKRRTGDAGDKADLQDPELEQSLTTVLSLATNYLDDPDPPSPELADWAATLETNSTIIADGLASRLLDFRRALALFAGTGRPEEAVLRKHIAWVDARRLLEKELRCLAARDHPVDPEVAELITAMRESTKSRVLQDSSGGDAVRRAKLLDSAIKFEDAVVEKMTALKEKLTRGAAVFFAGEEELVQAPLKHAATAEAEIAESQAFSAVFQCQPNSKSRGRRAVEAGAGDGDGGGAATTEATRLSYRQCLAARDHPVDPEVAALITAMRESTKSRVLQDSSGGDAVRRAKLLDSAIKFEDAVVEKMTALEKLTRGATAFAGEEELMQALQKHAATAEAEIMEAQAFSAVLLADANRAASPVVDVQKRPAPETETEEEEEPPRQRRRTSLTDSAAQD